MKSILLGTVVVCLACSSSGEGGQGNSGGTGAAQGGSTASGGNPAKGGSTSGGSSSGGATLGGATASGGATSNGGSLTNGGVSPNAGTTNAGATARGGAPVGGTNGAAGSSPRGGAGGVGNGGAAGASTAGAAGAPAAGAGGTGSSVKVCAATGTLKQAAACNDKLIGTALAQGSLSNNTYTNAAKEFNYATPENEMKWDTIESSQGNFNFGPGDTIVNFAQQNGMKVKGHTLVWHSQLPNWVSSLSGADNVRKVMLNHIDKVMTHFKGKIYAWDVVNEAWDTPSKKGDGTATLRSSVFKNQIGEGFIDEAFKAAKAADSSALLFYNDYSTEGMNDKSNAVYNMVKGMKERGIPIDGVGIQTHIGTPNDSPTAAEVKENIDRLAALGLQVVISEMDINGCDGISADQMATLYHDIVAGCVAQPLCTAITVWGISDAGSWLNSFSEAGCNGKQPTPLLWDASYGKKGTYNAVIKALTGN